MAEDKIVWSPLPGSQTLAMSCPAQIIVYHGSRGPGKTDSQLMRFRSRVGQGYGRHWRGIIFDREYKNLDDLVSKSMRWFPEFKDGCRFINSKSDYKWVWKTGEELLFRTVKKDQDYWSYHGQEFPFIGWNELTKYPTGNLFEMMMSCNRSSFRPEDFPFYINGWKFERDRVIEYVGKDHKYAEQRLLPEISLEVFATCNPHGCVPYGEVLTKDNGWVDIKLIRAGDEVITCDKYGNAKTGVVSAVTHAKWADGMLSRKGRGINMEFTSSHRFPHLNTSKTEHVVKHFWELPNQSSIRRTATSWNGKFVETLNGFNSVDFMELLGWFIAEGCMINRLDNSEINSFQISQSKENTRIRINNLLIRMGLKYRTDKQSFTISNKVLADIFRLQGKCRDKFIPKEYLSLSTELLQSLYTGLMLGDGCNNIYYTLSEKLKDDFSELCVKLGFAVYVSERDNNRDKANKNWHEPVYEICHGRKTNLALITGNHVYNVDTTNKSQNVGKTDFEGMVYCITVPETETFFIRQKGYVWLSGNTGHTWVKRRFISASPMGKILRNTVNVYNPRTQKREDVVKTQVHIFGSYRENKYLSPEYVATLESIDEPNKKKAWLHGDWDVVAGGMFDDLWDSGQHVVTPFKIPESWRIDRSFDWGSSAPFSVGWWAESDGSEIVLPNGKTMSTVRGDIFRIKEWYGSNGRPNEGLRMLAEDVAAGIVERELSSGLHLRVVPGPADNSIYDVENGNSIGASMAQKVKVLGKVHPGVTWMRSDKSSGSRKAGWEKIRTYLRDAKQPYILDQFGKPMLDKPLPREKPGLFVFNTCKNFIDLVPCLPRSEKDPDDVDTEAEDHIGDEVRYKILSIGLGARGGKTKGTQ